jgi:hypothetical protein
MALFMDMHDLKAAVALDDVAKARRRSRHPGRVRRALPALLGR